MPRIDELYNALNKQGLYTKSLDDFKTQFSTPEAINQLHFALKQEGLYTKPLSDFNNQFFSDQLKKKEEALPSMPSAEGGLLGTTPMPQDQPLVSFGEVMPSEAEQSPIFQQYQEQRAQQPQGLGYGLPEQKPATPFVQETKKGLFGEELPVQAQPTVPQKPLEVVQSLLPYNFEDLTEAEKITALTQASNSPEVLKSIQTDIESERKKIAEEIEAEKARIAAEEAKNVSDLEKLTRAGIASGKLANKIAYLETLPTAPTSSDFFEIASLMKEIQENTVEDEGGTIGFFKHLPGVVYQSLVSMATAAPTGVAGAAAGGVAGSVAGPGGIITGLISGFGGGSSLALEYSSSLMSSLQEAGVNVTSARELSDAFNSPEKMSIAREYALKRGIPVAVFDAISGGIAGKFFKPVAGATAKQVMNAALKETGLQSGLGGLGELSAQLIADGEVNMRDVLYEMVAEPVTSIPEIAAGRMSSNTKSIIAKEVATPQQKDALSSIDTKLREVNNAQISTTDETTKSVLGDVATKLEEEKSAVLSEIEKNFDFMTDEEAANVLSASREIKTLQDKAEQVRNNPEMTDDQKKLVLSELKRQAETFDNQRKEIIQNAVQKQATSEVPVQPEARVGEEVAQGAPEAKPEVVTKEGVQEEVTIDTPAIVANTKPEVDVVVAAAPEVETGQTFNSDGTVYSNGGLVVPVTSENITQQELTPERIAEFVEANKAKIGSNAVKVGIYKFPNSNKVSLDLNIVVPKENRAAALEFGKMAGQESLFDLDTFENVKTGADGMNPMSFTDDQFKQIAKSLSEGKVPDFMMAPVDQATVGKTIQNTAQSLQVAFPEVEFIVGDNLEDTRARIVEALTPRVGMEKAQEVANDFKDVRGQALFAGERPVAIVVDKAAANTRTAGHEAWEVMLNDAFGKNPEKFAEFRKSIDRQLRLSGFNDIAEELRAFSETYSKEGNEVVFREYMAEFGGMLVEGGFDIQNLTPQQKSLLQKIKDIINDFAIQLTGKEVFLKDATAENIIDFMSTISQKVAKGETVEEFFETKDTTEIENTNTVFKNRSQKIGDFDIYYFEDEAEFQKLVDDGLVVQNASIDEAAGEPVAVHQPDNLFVGNLSYKGKKIMDGNGGVYYVLKFGNVWASGAKSSASGLVKLINESRAKSSDKKARLVLVRGSQDKMISSVQGVKAAMQVLEELVFSGLISTSDFRTALKAAGKKYNIDFSGTSSASSIKADIENKFMNVSDSTFEKRGTFFSDLVDELGKLESPKKNIKEIQKAIGAKKNIRFTKQGIREQLGTIMTERLLLGLPSSHAYAMIEVDEDVTFKEDKEHPSYPYAIVTKSGKPPVLKIFGYRPKAVEAIRRIDGSPASNAQLGLAQRGMGIGRVATDAKITARAQKKAPAAISEDVYKYLTEDENGNIVFHHYSSSQRNQIKPSSGQGSLLTSKEEQQALSSVGGLAMYYAQEGQKEPGVGNELHTVVVPRDKVYDIRKDPMNFYDEAKERFLEHMNRNNTGKPIEYAFSPNYQVAWITKVAGENGFDMTVAQWKNKADYRAQSTKTLTPEAENIKMKPIEGEIEVGDLVQIYGQESVITDIDENGVLSYVQKGSSGKFDLPMSKRSMRMGKATLLDKGPYIFDEANQEPVKETIISRDQKLTPEEIEVLNENFGIQDGKVELKARSQKITPSEVKAVSESLSSLSESKLESLKELIHKDVKAPQKTQKAYKLFKVKKNFPGELFPLFVGANESVTTGDWIEAKAGELTTTKEGKTMVKSTLGPLAYRPGWHSGEFAIATHIGAKKNALDKAPSLRDSDQVWAEVEVGNDFDWQTEANRRADRNKNGDIVPRTAHITDQIPSGGNYKYKTNSNMTGSWIISGEMKVNRVLTDEEVARINKESGSNDLPRLAPFDFDSYGFNQDGTPKDKKQVISNQVARAYIVAKETGENPELVSAVDSLTTITARAQKINYKDIPGYDRMRNEVDGIIEKATKRGATKARIAEDVINYVQKSAVYERANDSQREQMIRDLKKELGQRVKSAPRVERILDIKPEEKELVTNTQMIAERAKAAKYSEKYMQSVLDQISKEVMQMKQKGKITLAQMRAIINRAAKVKLVDEKSVRSFIEYVDRIMNNAEYAEKGLLLNKKLPNAKRNAARKIGIADGLSPLLQKLFSINSFVVPKEVFNDYAELVEMFADRSTVLSLGDIDVVTAKAKKVLDAVEGEMARAEALAEVFDSYDNKVTDKDGKLLYSETINQMVSDGSISPEDGELMKKYKSLIVERTKKDPRSEEEIEEERLELVDAVKSYIPIYSQLPSLDERNLARSLYELIKSGAVDKMNNKDLKDLLKVLDNIENGFLPHYAQILKEKMNQINNGESLAQAASKAKTLPLERVYAKLKSLFGKERSAYVKAIERNPLFFIDELFGNFNSRPIFNAVFKPVSQAYSKYQGDINTIISNLNDALINISKSYGNNPNKTQYAKQKLMAYMLQREFQSNVGKKDVNSAKAFLDETIAFAEDNEQNTYSKKDIENLKEIRDKFFNSEEVDLDAVYETFNKAEKKAIDLITKINDSMSDKVAFTSAIIRGRKVGSINKYVHHNVLMDKSTIDDVTDLSIADMFNASMKPSTKAKSLEERTGKVTPLVFDPFSSTVRGAKYLLMDYHLTEPIRTARRTLNYAKANSKGEAKKIVNAISKSLEQALSNVLSNSYAETSFADEVVSYMEKTGYRIMLASVPRAVSELTSNLAYVALYDPKSYLAGLGYSDITMSSDGLDVMRNSGSQQIERIYPSSKLSGKILDSETMSQASGIKAGRSLNDVANVSSIIYNNSLKKVKNFAESTSDYMVSTPDKAVMKPLWFGAYASEFKRITGRDVDFNKIAAGDEVYLTKNKEAIKKASDHADETSVRVGASDNPFTGILKGANSKNKSTIMNVFNKFNNFMTRFLIYEYSTARTGVYALMGEGKLTRAQGAAILGATMSRMMLYSFLSSQLVNLMLSALFGPDEEDDDTILQDMSQSAASAFTGLLLGRNFGNLTKAPINIAVEKFNEKFLDSMRTGEYDPYEDAIQYTIIPKDKKKQGDPIEWVKPFTGAFSPAISTVARAIKVASKTDLKQQDAIDRRAKELMTRTPLEIMGNLGYVPFYKDISRIMMKELYKDLEKGKKSGSQPGGVIKGEIIQAK